MIEKDDTITNTKKLIYSKEVIISPPYFRAKINWRSHLIHIDFYIVTIDGEPFLNCTFLCGAPYYQLKSFFLEKCIGFSFFKLYAHKSSKLKDNIVLNEKLRFSGVKEIIISKSSHFEGETTVSIIFSKEDSDRIIDLIFDKGITRGKLHNMGMSHVVIGIFLDYKET